MSIKWLQSYKIELDEIKNNVFRVLFVLRTVVIQVMPRSPISLPLIFRSCSDLLTTSALVSESAPTKDMLQFSMFSLLMVVFV